ncbi:MAG: type II secretion system protein GspD, partial [Armatimonadota bacterium]
MMLRAHDHLIAVAVCLLVVASTTPPLLAQDAYCSITDVTTKALSNGATITVEADGMLQYDLRGRDEQKVSQIVIELENARSALDNDIIRPDDAYPISYISFTMPDDARNGIGLLMTVELVDPSNFTIPEQSDQQRLVVNIRTERTVPRAAGEDGDDEDDEGDDEKEEETLEVTCDEQGLVTVRALKADIHRVVAELARQAGVNVAVDDAVSRKVSLNVTGLTPQQVMQGIASGYGLAISSVGDVQMLSEGIPTDLPTYGRSATASYPLTYLKVDDAASLLPPFLIEYLRRNPQQNSIVVTAPRQMLDKIGTDLRAIDIAPPLIMVEVLGMEITRDGSGENFLEWAYYGPDSQFIGSTREGEVDYAEGESYGISGGVVDTEELSVHVRALVNSGSARIHAEPRMAAMNGERASIFIGRDRFIRMTYLRYGEQQERIETVRVGVSLSIRPWTGGNGEITSSVECEVSNIVDIDPETGIPRLSTRKAEATVRARDGETIIIGGLLQRQQEKTDRRIPILSDIPIIGQLFRSSNTRTTDSELIFFVTPRVIDPESAGQMADDAIEQLGGATAVTCPAPLGARQEAERILAGEQAEAEEPGGPPQP